ncbi:MAG: PLP-dependent aminotransferase family protein [Holophagales bacterium]|nr:PLP-dependent aminotransferase family protein [Holophagales bacterium]
MTIWTPTLEEGPPRYRAIADAIAEDLASGRLTHGDRLPTHRQLARALGVTVGTVSRGYAEAERRGLTSGEVGRGTFVRGAVAADPWPESAPADGGTVDLSLSLPASLPEEGELLAETLQRIASDPETAGALLKYQPETGSPRQRAVAARWLSRLGLRVRAEDLWITAGSQHALNVVLSAVFRSGEVLLTEELTYPSIKAQARAYGLRLRGVQLDAEGIHPDALERACRQEPRPTGLYVVPTIQNPTGVTQSAERRKRLAEIAEAHGLWIVEDDVHAFLPRSPLPPIATFAPNRCLYLASVAKCLAPGLRTGYLIAPASLRRRLLAAIHTSLWMPPPLMVELTTRWLEDGTAERLITAKRSETEARQRRARELLAGHPAQAHPSGYQLWLELPEPLYSEGVVSQARERGVIVVGAGAFAVDRHRVPQAIRLSLGAPSRPELDRGLTILAEILAGGGTLAY